MASDATPTRPLEAVDAVLAAFALLIGLGTAAVAIFAVPSFAQMFQDFGGELPVTTKLVLTRAYAPAVALLTIALTATGIIIRRRAILVAALVLPLAAAAFLTYGLYAPIFELADHIR